jgi:hypothetical protein
MRTAIHVIGTAALAAVAAAAFALATGVAFNAHREWEMGAIPLMLAAFVFVGLFAGTIAGLACPRHPYLAASLASFLVFVIADLVNDFKVELTPQMTRDERREFWANIEGLLLAGFPLGVPFALWGGLMADTNAKRLRVLRDVSYGFAGFIGFVALIPLAVHWLPWQMGIPAAAIAALVFVVWLARRTWRAAA